MKEDNTREVLLLEVNPTQSSTVWEEYLESLKNRGVEQVDLIVADGLSGFSQVVRKQFPGSDIQGCVVHLQGGLLRRVRPKDKEAFSRAIKEAFTKFDKRVSSRKIKDISLKMGRELWWGSQSIKRNGVYRGILDVYKLSGRSEASNIQEQVIRES